MSSVANENPNKVERGSIFTWNYRQLTGVYPEKARITI